MRIRISFWTFIFRQGLIVICLFGGLANLYAQESVSYTDVQKDSIYSAWLDDLNRYANTVNEDSIHVTQETLRLIEDDNYRKIVYPVEYTWPLTLKLIEVAELKIAFWHFINLYMISDENKILVIRSILAYDRVFKTDNFIVNSFYNYSYTDPEISHIIDGRPVIYAPHILEEKLAAAEEIVSYVEAYRIENKSNTSNSK